MRNRGLSRVWAAIGHISRVVWVYHVVFGVAVGALTFLDGRHINVPIAYLVPLTVVAVGGTLYVFNQLIIIFNRFREGYAFGLAYEGLVLALDQNSTLQISAKIHNATDRPLRYEVERFDVVIENITIANPTFRTSGGVIPRGANREYRYPPFKKEQISQFIGKNVKGSVTFDILYGHPDGSFVRRLKMKLSIYLRLTTDSQHGIQDIILSERDEAA